MPSAFPAYAYTESLCDSSVEEAQLLAPCWSCQRTLCCVCVCFVVAKLCRYALEKPPYKFAKTKAQGCEPAEYWPHKNPVSRRQHSPATPAPGHTTRSMESESIGIEKTIQPIEL